jgi:threonine synthase
MFRTELSKIFWHDFRTAGPSNSHRYQREERHMQFISTRGSAPPVSVSEAILKGLAPDGGLYVPESLPAFDRGLIDPEISGNLSYPETALAVLRPFFAGDFLESELEAVCREAFSFPVPIHWYNEREAVLELIHGPTAAFKDFGARFLAGTMERITEHEGTPLTILVATSGDTGGAVAAAFAGKRNISVKVLFPKGRVSARQEKQLTCWGENVQAYSVRGAFDDCQRMVKSAFMDPELSAARHLTSANSINSGRLLPQTVYYVYASVRYLAKTGKKPVIIIPSGNVGNSVGAYWAKAMGAPIERIVLAVNANTTIPDFLASGVYEPRESIATLANAMDVGDPSNMERLRHLFPSIEEIRENITAYSVSDGQIQETIGRIWQENGYAVCPHTAAGEYVRRTIARNSPAMSNSPTMVVATAHPAKFETIVEPTIGESVPIPPQLAELLHRPGSAAEIDPDSLAFLDD